MKNNQPCILGLLEIFLMFLAENPLRSSLNNRVRHAVSASGPDIEQQKERKDISEDFQDDSEHFMFHTGPVQFPQVENQEAEGTDEEHDDQEGVRGASHDIEGKWEQNRHVVYFELVNLFKPAFNDGVLLVGLAGLDD